MTTFENIKKTAQDRRLNLKTVATKAGLSENAIYSWRNKDPRTESLQAVADVLGVSVDYLLGNTDEMHPTTTQKKNVSPKDVHIINKIETADLTDEQKDQLDHYIDFLKAEHVRILSQDEK